MAEGLNTYFYNIRIICSQISWFLFRQAMISTMATHYGFLVLWRCWLVFFLMMFQMEWFLGFKSKEPGGSILETNDMIMKILSQFFQVLLHITQPSHHIRFGILWQYTSEKGSPILSYSEMTLNNIQGSGLMMSSTCSSKLSSLQYLTT